MSHDRFSRFPPGADRAHRAELERQMDPRARSLLVALEVWLPPRIAWERAIAIAGPLLLLEGSDAARTRPELIDADAAITEALSDTAAMNGLPATAERMAQATRAWRAAGRTSQTRLTPIGE